MEDIRFRIQEIVGNLLYLISNCDELPCTFLASKLTSFGTVISYIQYLTRDVVNEWALVRFFRLLLYDITHVKTY